MRFQSETTDPEGDPRDKTMWKLQGRRRQSRSLFCPSQGSGTTQASAYNTSGLLPKTPESAHDLKTQPSSSWVPVSYLSRSRLQTNPRRKKPPQKRAVRCGPSDQGRCICCSKSEALHIGTAAAAIARVCWRPSRGQEAGTHFQQPGKGVVVFVLSLLGEAA